MSLKKQYNHVRDAMRASLKASVWEQQGSRRTLQDAKRNRQDDIANGRPWSLLPTIQAAFEVGRDGFKRRAIHLFLCFLRGRTLEQCEPTGRLRQLGEMPDKTALAARVALSKSSLADVDILKLNRDQDLKITFISDVTVTGVLGRFRTWLEQPKKTISDLVGTQVHSLPPKPYVLDEEEAPATVQVATHV